MWSLTCIILLLSQHTISFHLPPPPITHNHRLLSTTTTAIASTLTPSLTFSLSTTELSRTVASVCTAGTLSTLIKSTGIPCSTVDGSPFGSYVDYILDNSGNPVFLMNEKSQHTLFLTRGMEKEGEEAKATLFAQYSPPGSGGSQDMRRISLVGTVKGVDEKDEELTSIRTKYSIAHSYADRVMDSPMFRFYRLTPKQIYYVGGFGVSSKWIEAAEYKKAMPDMLAGVSNELVVKLNEENDEDISNVVTWLLGVKEQDPGSARITSVDRLGIDVRVSRVVRKKLVTDEYRIGFRTDIMSVEDAKSEIQKVFQDAYEIGEGMVAEDEIEKLPIFKFAEDGLGMS